MMPADAPPPAAPAGSLDLAAAAAFLGIHPDTLAERARAGIIPGAKIGRAWRFLAADLAAYFRAQYRCPSTSAPIPPSGISTCAILAADALDALLAPSSAKPRNANTTSLRLVSGKSNKPGGSSPTRCSPGRPRGRAAQATCEPCD